ncbi:MAG: radical SAM protein [Deltaproteobacteria bacterium]|nr:radical SAM protein [Deltaproteobacteria bacterium]
MYAYHELRKLHFEITDKCNATCPQCPRNDCGGTVNPRLPLVELSVDDVRRMVPESLVRQLRHIYACGNYGDPVVAKDTLAIFSYFRRANDKAYLGLHTNGSARKPEWWAELGRLMRHPTGYVRFSIDGLEDTNAVYRRNTRWRVIMQSVEAFIGAGGNAEWDFLVFRHNEHQVEAARARAKAMGFTRFTAKATARFFDGQRLQHIDRTPVKDKSGNVVSYLERPLSPEWNNEALTRMRAVTEHYGTSTRYLDTTTISCKVAAEKAIYISADGVVLPCCWLGARSYMASASQQEAFAQMVAAAGGVAALNAKHHSIEAIVAGPLFQRGFPESFAKRSLTEGRIYTCAWICGELTPSTVQWKNSERFPAPVLPQPVG